MSWREDAARRQREEALRVDSEQQARVERLAEQRGAERRESAVPKQTRVQLVEWQTGSELRCVTLTADTRVSQLRNTMLQNTLTNKEKKKDKDTEQEYEVVFALSAELLRQGRLLLPTHMPHLRDIRRKVIVATVRPKALTDELANCTVRETLLALHKHATSRFSALPKDLLHYLLAFVGPARPAVVSVSSSEVSEGVPENWDGKTVRYFHANVSMRYTVDRSYRFALRSLRAVMGKTEHPSTCSLQIAAADAEGVFCDSFGRLVNDANNSNAAPTLTLVAEYEDGTKIESRTTTHNCLDDYINAACWTGDSWISKEKRACELRPGDEVMTERGIVKVAAVIISRINAIIPLWQSEKGDVVLTAGHPVFDRDEWGVPAANAHRWVGEVYNFELADRCATKLYCGQQQNVVACPLGCFAHPVWGDAYWDTTLPKIMRGEMPNVERCQ